MVVVVVVVGGVCVCVLFVCCATNFYQRCVHLLFVHSCKHGRSRIGSIPIRRTVTTTHKSTAKNGACCPSSDMVRIGRLIALLIL